MPQIPLEDTFYDVIAKAQRGWKVSDARLAELAGITPADLLAVQQGKPLYAVIRRIARHLRLDPEALETLAKKAWYPKQPIFPRGFAMFNTPYGELTVNSYLIWDSRSRLAAAIDTGTDATGMLDVLRSEGLTLRDIFITHTHPDHVAALPALVAATSGQVWCHEREPALDCPHKTFKENAYFHLGDEVAIKALLTNGHSPGLTTFYITGLSWPLACVGDALFACSSGGSATLFDQQYRVNRQKILALPKDTVIAPGHGPLTTLAQERKYNPFYAVGATAAHHYAPSAPADAPQSP